MYGELLAARQTALLPARLPTMYAEPAGSYRPAALPAATADQSVVAGTPAAGTSSSSIAPVLDLAVAAAVNGGSSRLSSAAGSSPFTAIQLHQPEAVANVVKAVQAVAGKLLGVLLDTLTGSYKRPCAKGDGTAHCACLLFTTARTAAAAAGVADKLDNVWNVHSCRLQM